MILKVLHLLTLVSIGIIFLPVSAVMFIIGFIYSLMANQFLKSRYSYSGLSPTIMELIDDIFNKKKVE